MRPPNTLPLPALAIFLASCVPGPTDDDLLAMGGDPPGDTAGSGTCPAAEELRMPPPVDVEPDDRQGFCLAIGADAEAIEAELFFQEDCLGVDVPGALTLVAGVSLYRDSTDVDYSADFRVVLPASIQGVQLPSVPEGTTLLVAKVTEFQGERLLRLANIATVHETDGVRVLETRTELASEHMSGALRVDGPGLYAVFAADAPLGFISGQVTLDGEPVPGALLTATRAPFIAFADEAGQYTIASLRGQAGVVGYDLETGATGSAFLPVEAADGVNPKTGEAAETPATEAPVPTLDTLNLTGVEVKLQLPPPPPPPGELLNLDFESGTLGPWTPKGKVSVLDEDFAGLFAASRERRYAFLTTGQGAEDGARSALVRDFDVPTDATRLHVRYAFVSQEYPAWLDSPYNDLFVVFQAGSTGFLLAESVQSNTSAWQDYFSPLGNVEASGAEVGGVHHVFGGRLAMREATLPVTPCAGRPLRLVFAVSDIGDTIYDSAALIDAVWFD